MFTQMKSELGRMFLTRNWTKKLRTMLFFTFSLDSMRNTCLTIGTNQKNSLENHIHADLWWFYFR